MRYRDLLNTQDWNNFRRDFMEFRRTSEGDSLCDDCGFETSGQLHVHHKVYHKGLLPWQYEFIDLRLICQDCHELIHETEALWRQFIRKLPPHVCCELHDFLTALLEIENPELIKVALARAKNTVRFVKQ
jgi:HNH endonuclease